MNNILQWITHEGGWKVVICLTYIIICLFDFVIVPSWIGINRTNLDMLITYFEQFETLPLTVQQELIKLYTHQHQPYTLGYGGVFHLSFGAILTGSALTGNKNDK